MKNWVFFEIIVVGTFFCFSPLQAEGEPLSANIQYVLPDRSAGLFSEFASVIGALDYFDKGKISGLIVDFKDQGFYFSPKKGANWWSYYFKPVRVKQRGNQFQGRAIMTDHHNCRFSIYAVSGLEVKRAHQIVHKYIRLQPCVKRKIARIVGRKLKHAFVIGVHFRGTDKVGGNHYFGNIKIWAEAQPVSYQRVADKIQEIKKGINKRLKIYVATDELQFLEYMKQQFGKMIVYQKCYRSTNGSPIHYNQQQDPYKIGLEAVVDCVMLAQSDVLIKTASNLSACALMFNPKMQVFELSLNDWQKNGAVTEVK